jgi:hypothetical protein
MKSATNGKWQITAYCFLPTAYCFLRRKNIMKIRLLMTVIIAVMLVSSAIFLARFGQRRNVSETKIKANENVSEKSRLVESFGKIPLHFEPNVGQTNEQVKFSSRGYGYSLFLTSNEAILALKNQRPKDQNPKLIFCE